MGVQSAWQSAFCRTLDAVGFRQKRLDTRMPASRRAGRSSTHCQAVRHAEAASGLMQRPLTAPGYVGVAGWLVASGISFC